MQNKYVLILGDFMIDEWWLVSETTSSTSEFHAGIEPSKRVLPYLRKERAGAASIIAQTIALFAGCDFLICGLGLWNPEDDERWVNLGFTNPKFCLRRLRTQGESSLVTTVKLRVLRHKRDRPPELLYRFDQDPDPERISFEEQPIPSELRTVKNNVTAVVIADFCKGAVANATLTHLKQWLGNCSQIPWFVESKSLDAATIFANCAVQTFFFNRKEAVRLAKRLGLKVDLIPRGEQPTDQLLDVGEKLLQELNAKQVVITLGPDGAAAFWKADPNGEHWLVCSAPSQEKGDFPGVSAGDVFMGRWIAEWLKKPHATPGELLMTSAKTAHRWCIYQDIEFWVNQDRLSDAPAPQENALSHNLPDWRPASPCSLSDARKDLARHRRYPAMLEGDECRLRLQLKQAQKYLGSFVTTDPILGDALMRFRSHLVEYGKQTGYTRPHVSLLHAQPGSGKTFLARQLAQATGYQLHEVNISRLNDLRELTMHFDHVASISARRTQTGGPLPLLFLDEFDCKVAGGLIFGYLLSPLGEGVYEVAAQVRHLGKVAILLAGSTGKSLNELEDWMKTQTKGPDLLSRINGLKLELAPLSEADRVYLAASLITKRFPNVQYIEKGLLDIFAAATEASVRGIEQMVDLLEARGDKLRRDDIPSSVRSRFPTVADNANASSMVRIDS